MGYKAIAAIAAIAILVAASLLADAEVAAVRVPYSPIQYLKNFALSTCIADGYKSDEVVKDSSAAAGGYLELGRLPFEAYEEAAALGKKFLAKDYQSISGDKLTLMKCIDFFHSKELDQLAKKYGKS
jgi:Type VI secretion system (T6SS), amidase immunity protein